MKINFTFKSRHPNAKSTNEKSKILSKLKQSIRGEAELLKLSTEEKGQSINFEFKIKWENIGKGGEGGKNYL